MSTYPGHNARASVVNRTHRVVREQALNMREQKEKSRSLWLPLAISSVLLVLLCYAAWAMLGNELTTDGVPDASDQLMVMLMWCVPVTALAIAIVWFKRERSGSEVSQ